MVKLIVANGKITKNREKVNIFGQPVKNILGNIKIIKDRGVEK
jgi:hypothetical protein